jgi:hypothetical protein
MVRLRRDIHLTLSKRFIDHTDSMIVLGTVLRRPRTASALALISQSALKAPIDHGNAFGSSACQFGLYPRQYAVAALIFSANDMPAPG